MIDVTKIVAYESGELDEDETIALFQELIDTGLAWKVQGHYGRTARDLIDAGLCHVCTPDTLVFEGQYGKPAVGQAWRCTVCRRPWSKVGDKFYPADSEAHLPPPEVN